MKGFEEESLGSADEEKDATESVERDTAAPVEPAAHEDEAPAEPVERDEATPAEPVALEEDVPSDPAAPEAQTSAEPVALETERVADFHRTRESLEGAVVNPVQISDEESAHLVTGAVGVSPSVKRVGRERTILDALGSGFDDLEPKTKASARAAGTARFMGEAPENEADKVPAKDEEDSEKGASGPDPEKEGESPASDPQPARRRMPLPAKVLIVLLVLLFAAAALAWAWVSGIERSMSVSEEDRADLETALVKPANEEQDEAFYMLIIGSDARGEGEPSRSDVIMLARVDPPKGLITLVSIPRDTMIYRDDGSIEKINAEYNYGPAATVRAVSEFAGVDIAHYVEVSFEGLEQVVDALGGVRVDIPNDIMAYDDIFLPEGEQVLNGEQALAFARERHNSAGGDFGRVRAQRQIVNSILEQVLASAPSEMPFIIKELAECISTDLTISNIITCALEMRGAENGLTVYSSTAPSYAIDEDGTSYVATMYDEWRAMMQRVDAGINPDDETAQVPDEQLENERLGSASNAAGSRDYSSLAESSPLTTDDVSW